MMYDINSIEYIARAVDTWERHYEETNRRYEAATTGDERERYRALNDTARQRLCYFRACLVRGRRW